MMKFDRIHRNANDTVVHVVMVDRFAKRIELWRWAAGKGDPSPPVLVKAVDYYDHVDRFSLAKKMNDDARHLSKLDN